MVKGKLENSKVNPYTCSSGNRGFQNYIGEMDCGEECSPRSSSLEILRAGLSNNYRGVIHFSYLYDKGKKMWKVIFQDILSGEPVAMGRPRAGKYGVYTPSRSKKYLEDHLEPTREKYSKSNVAPLEGPLKVHIVFIFTRPQRLLRKKDPDSRIWKETKPDIDNLCKMVLDLLTKAGAWGDDKQIVSVEAEKYYCSKGEAPQTTYTIYTREK